MPTLHCHRPRSLSPRKRGAGDPVITAMSVDTGCPACAGHDSPADDDSPISNTQPRAIARIVCGAGCAVLRCSPLGKARGWSAERRNQSFCERSLRTAAPLGAPPGQACAVRAYFGGFAPQLSPQHRPQARASRPVNRARGRYPRAGPAVQQAPCRAVLVPLGRGPETSRARVCETRAQAPHPVPLA